MRRYRITPEGEKPIWPSKKRLEQMGAEAGRRAWWSSRTPPLRYGNPTYDKAALEAYKELEARHAKAAGKT